MCSERQSCPNLSLLSFALDVSMETESLSFTGHCVSRETSTPLRIDFSVPPEGSLGRQVSRYLPYSTSVHRGRRVRWYYLKDSLKNGCSRTFVAAPIRTDYPTKGRVQCYMLELRRRTNVNVHKWLLSTSHGIRYLLICKLTSTLPQSARNTKCGPALCQRPCS